MTEDNKRELQDVIDGWDGSWNLCPLPALDDLCNRLIQYGYRLDPYPNGKSKVELIARIEALEAERDKARGLLRDLSANLGDLGYYLQDHKAINLKKIADNVANAMVFLAETSTVKS